MTEHLLVFPSPAPADVVRNLDMAGHKWVAVASVEEANEAEPETGWTGAVIAIEEDPERGWGLCRELRKRDVPIEPLLLLVNGSLLDELEHRADAFDDFLIVPFHPREFDARLAHLFWRAGRGTRPELVEYGPLALNIETYQASIDSRPLDLTYMEYELLKFLAASPGRVFSREILLSQVWGYDYYGGARTVDVHIRRLRAKLGEEHSNLIQTVRSVGYKLGQTRWGTER